MHVIHLTASTFFGGPERQMLGLAGHLPPDYRTTFLSFPEGGRCAVFLGAVGGQGFPARALGNDTPRFRAAVNELADTLRRTSADVLLCHGYKPNILGRVAARRVSIPVAAVSRGWTGETWKVRAYELADRLSLRLMDRVVAVSDGQAARVRAAGVPGDRVVVIRNAARLAAFADPDPAGRVQLSAYFPGSRPPAQVVLAAGRLSPEKGFSDLIESATELRSLFPKVGFVLFGEGTERAKLTDRVRELGIADRFILPGFTDRLDRFLPWADVAVLPSLTEGLPNVALEASAAGIPVVATAVGGTPEVVADGQTGFLVPPRRPDLLAGKIRLLLADDPLRRAMGRAGRRRMEELFTFEAQARAYVQLFADLRKDSPCRPSRRFVDRLRSRLGRTRADRSASAFSSTT